MSLSTSPCVLTALETIDSPNVSSIPAPDGRPTTPSARRTSPLPPLPTIPHAGPSSGPQRYFYVAVKRGHVPGVYPSWPEAEKQIVNHPSPVFRTFATRFAAEAFVSGWDGVGRHSLPTSSPKPLREHLAMTFPSSVQLAALSSNRPSYHARLLSHAPSTDTILPHTNPTDFTPSLSFASGRSTSYRHSLVKVSSPLRQADDGSPHTQANIRKTKSMIGPAALGGLPSPPSSPEVGPHPPPLQGWKTMDKDTLTKAKSVVDLTSWSARINPMNGLISPSPPGSPSLLEKTLAAEKRRSTRTMSRLWADAIPPVPPLPSPVDTQSPPNPTQPDLPVSNAPKFSRSGMKKKSIVMPVAAPRPSSSHSRSSSPITSKRLSLFLSPSMTSLPSSSSSQSTTKPIHRNPSQPNVSTHRLSTLAETSRRELQLTNQGLINLDSLIPPRPAFMRQSSSSSLSSMSSLTSASSSTIDSCEPDIQLTVITPHQLDHIHQVSGHVDHVGPMVASRIRIKGASGNGNDGEDTSVESSSLSSGKDREKKKGLFKRLGQALKKKPSGMLRGQAG